jgi:hypothetical protein
MSDSVPEMATYYKKVDNDDVTASATIEKAKEVDTAGLEIVPDGYQREPPTVGGRRRRKTAKKSKKMSKRKLKKWCKSKKNHRSKKGRKMCKK